MSRNLCIWRHKLSNAKTGVSPTLHGQMKLETVYRQIQSTKSVLPSKAQHCGTGRLPWPEGEDTI